MHGIICIETEWQITSERSRRTLNSEPLIRFVGELHNVPVIYRRVATLAELQYYFKQFRRKEFLKYDIIYLNFHGQTHSISLEGEDKLLSLTDLSEMAGSLFNNRFVHFSSCRTLLGSDTVVAEFMNKTGARILTGYTKSVDCDLSAIHDVALIGEYIKRKQIPTMFKYLEANYGMIEQTLGFKHFE